MKPLTIKAAFVDKIQMYALYAKKILKSANVKKRIFLIQIRMETLIELIFISLVVFIFLSKMYGD